MEFRFFCCIFVSTKTNNNTTNVMKTSNIHFNAIVETPEYKELEALSTKHFIDFEERTFKQTPSKWAIEMNRLSFVAKLAKVFDQYILNSDKIENVTLCYGSSLEIKMNVIRDEEKHYFETSTIWAGGYIQIDHIRYIVKSNLRKLTNNEIVKQVKEEIKRVSTIERLTKDLGYVKSNLKNSEERSKVLEAMTADEVLENATAKYNVDYSFIVNDNFEAYRERIGDRDDEFTHKTLEDYEAYRVETKREFIERFKRHHDSDIKIERNRTKSFIKEVEKLQTKLEKLTK